LFSLHFQDLVERVATARGLDIDFRKARLLRHDRRALDLWRHSPEAFEHWVSFQKWGSGSPYNNCRWAFHFLPADLPGGGYGARFVCAHRVEDRWQYGGVQADRQPRKVLRSEFERYKVEPPGNEASDLHRVHAFDELSERVLVRWSGSSAGTRAWSQWWKHRKPIVTVDGRSLEELVIAPRPAPVPPPLEDSEFAVSVEPGEGGVEEGRRRLETHWTRERNRKVVAHAKAVWSAQEGGLRCAACGFDFEAVYGEHGAGFIEAHHVVPLNEVQEVTKTTVDDLAPLCSNCHRIIHKIRPMPGVAEFAAMIER